MKLPTNPVFYFVFRLLVGIMFFMHGSQKLFGWFSGNGPVELVSLMGLAGIIEVLAGIGITLGVLTQPLAALGAIQMLVAFFMVHAPNGLNPLVNKGELALLYFAAFLVLMTQGPGKYAVSKKN